MSVIFSILCCRQVLRRSKKELSEGLERKSTVHEEEMCTTASELAHDRTVGRRNTNWK